MVPGICNANAHSYAAWACWTTHSLALISLQRMGTPFPCSWTGLVQQRGDKHKRCKPGTWHDKVGELGSMALLVRRASGCHVLLLVIEKHPAALPALINIDAAPSTFMQGCSPMLHGATPF